MSEKSADVSSVRGRSYISSRRDLVEDVVNDCAVCAMRHRRGSQTVNATGKTSRNCACVRNLGLAVAGRRNAAGHSFKQLEGTPLVVSGHRPQGEYERAENANLESLVNMPLNECTLQPRTTCVATW